MIKSYQEYVKQQDSKRSEIRDGYDWFLNEFVQILKRNNLKYTRQREIILKSIYQYKDHFSAEELHDTLKENYPEHKIGFATVYRTLALLEQEELITSISFGVNGKKYESAIKDHHHHLICNICGSIEEFQNTGIEVLKLEVCKEYNFLMKSHLLQIHGICHDCQQNN